MAITDTIWTGPPVWTGTFWMQILGSRFWSPLFPTHNFREFAEQDKMQPKYKPAMRALMELPLKRAKYKKLAISL